MTLLAVLRTLILKTLTSAIVSVGTFPLILIAILGYLLGSFPTAYLLVRWKSNVDIRNAGSGNVGTLNSLLVSGSRVIGVVVLVGDVLKGTLAVLLCRALGAGEFWAGAVGGLAAVVGHNFPVWLRFKGGRGLATTAGVMFVFSWMLVAAWVAVWAIGFLLWRKVNIGNAFASAVIALAVAIAPGTTFMYILPASVPIDAFRIFALALMVIVLIKHGKPVQEYLKGRQPDKSVA